MNDEVLHKLKEIIFADLDLVTKQTILQIDDGFALFGRYMINPCQIGVKVTKDTAMVHNFDDTRLALCWCIADKCHQWPLADRIIRLDQTRQRLKADIDATTALNRRMKDSARRNIAEIKADHKKSVLKQVNHQLAKCVSVAKYWQIKGFQDEIARTRRPTANPSNRPGTAKSGRH